MESAVSLEETNRIRIELGLRPLGEAAGPTADGEEPPVDKDKEAEENWTRRREEEAKAAETKRIQEKISKAKNKRELNAKLAGATLGDDTAGDALSWAKKIKKRDKQRLAELAAAEKRAAEEDALDMLAMQDRYTEKDLTGIKVAHDVDAFEEGEHILTLKDSRILDGEDDELMNVDLADHEATEKNIELKRKRPGYTGYDDDEFDPENFTAGAKKKVLSKYDVDIDGEGETGFRLGGTIAPKKKKNASAEEDDTDANVNRTLLDGGLQYEKAREVSDYLQEGDVGFKKPKKKKKRSTRVVETDPNLALPVVASDGSPSSMQVDGGNGAASPPPPPPMENYVDDDEIQIALARARRLKTKKVVKATPEDLAKQLLEHKQEEVAAEAVARASRSAAQVEEEGGIAFDDTSEFVRTVHQPVVQVIRTKIEPSPAPPTAVKAEPEASTSGSQPTVKAEEMEVDLNAMIAPGGQDEDMAGGDESDEEEDEALALAALRQGLSVAEMRQKIDQEIKQEGVDEEVIPTARETTFSGKGLAGALAMLKSTGNLENATGETAERERIQKEKDLWLADRRRRIAQRELERIQARGGSKDQATREYDNRMREQREAQDALEQFKHYKPDIEIVYHDEFGRTLTPKEAWKALSHRFHGKGSGKGKTEKRLNKIKEERKRLAMAMGDTPTGMTRNFQERQEKTGEAFMILSNGNKGTVNEGSSSKGKGRGK